MPKFSAIFLHQQPVFDKIQPNFLLNRPAFGGRIFKKFGKFFDRISYFQNFLVPFARELHFGRIFSVFN
jgi:hypothetical protein